MRPRPAILLGSALLLCLAGCRNTAPLGGTAWFVTEVVSTEEPKSQVIHVVFGKDGRIVTKTMDDAGVIRTETREHYRVNGPLIEVDHPEYGFPALWRLTETGDLILIAETFRARLEPDDEG